MSKQGLASVGLDVKLGTNTLNYVQEVGDIGGTPSDLDATCLKDRMKKHVPGVQDVGAFEITYLFDNSGTDSDYRRIKSLQDGGTAVAVEVTLPDKTKFASTGYVNTYVVGTKVDELITAKAIVSLQSDWTVTNPSAT